jgi:hypothetical protein
MNLKHWENIRKELRQQNNLLKALTKNEQQDETYYPG